ncbi:lanthionine synthetase C family protein [Sinomicrobium oceani]|uniref:lanthionine synthetase C family protein n=1 Tax=Sinomicrobium oceani TaxID=1150368 RepID=UPI00227C6018|nr:lanthionine synthetase C family protein [Sinomicrobium oceani]
MPLHHKSGASGPGSENSKAAGPLINSAEFIDEKLKEIAAVLEKEYTTVADIGVLNGLSGIALFHFYYARYSGQEYQADLGTEITGRIFDIINEGYLMPTYCSGMAGALWTIEHLREQNFITIHSDTLLPPLEDYLGLCMDEYTDPNFYDFLHGMTGIGYYFLIRYRMTGSGVLKTRYAIVLRKVIDRLRDEAHISGDHGKWESWLIREEKLLGYNLSLAHGMSGVINFLSRLVVFPEFEYARPLLKQAVHYIMQWEHSIPGTSVFPAWITKNGDKSRTNRLGWCYGDPGIGISLWHAGKVLGEAELCRSAVRTLEYSALRKNPEEAEIRDAGLCHGAFGLMHMYRVMARETGNRKLDQAAAFWREKGMQMGVHPKGYAGYMQWRGGNKQSFQAEAGVLEGVAGIGLALMAETSPRFAWWNECMLIGAPVQ